MNYSLEAFPTPEEQIVQAPATVLERMLAEIHQASNFAEFRILMSLLTPEHLLPQIEKEKTEIIKRTAEIEVVRLPGEQTTFVTQAEL